MGFPKKQLDPLNIDHLNEDFAGPYEIGYEQIFELLPGVENQFIEMQVGPRIEDGCGSFEEKRKIGTISIQDS